MKHTATNDVETTIPAQAGPPAADAADKTATSTEPPSTSGESAADGVRTGAPRDVTVAPLPGVNADVLAIRMAARLVDGLLAVPFLLLFLIPIVGPMLFAAAQTAYFVVCESQFGGTIGKRVFNLEVRKDDGSAIDARGAFLRNGFLLFGLIPYLGAILTVLTFFVIGVAVALSSDRRGPHDKLGSARVVRPSAA